jgi:dolichol kinase
MKQEDALLPEICPAPAKQRKKATREEIAIEFTRKSIHLLIAFVPFLLSLSKPLTIALLLAGTAVYAIFEQLRMKGIKIPIVSMLTARATRLRDDGHFVTGPVTLGLGALISVMVFDPISASIAVYILAFGDGFSSLVGKTVGRISLPLTRGKSVEGSLTCFVFSLISAFLVSGQLRAALIIAAVSTLVEAAPTKDWDNILLPLSAGVTATLLGL